MSNREAFLFHKPKFLDIILFYRDINLNGCNKRQILYCKWVSFKLLELPRIHLYQLNSGYIKVKFSTVYSILEGETSATQKNHSYRHSYK